MSQINPSEEKDEVKAGEGTDWGDVANSTKNLADKIHDYKEGGESGSSDNDGSDSGNSTQNGNAGSQNDGASPDGGGESEGNNSSQSDNNSHDNNVNNKANNSNTSDTQNSNGVQDTNKSQGASSQNGSSPATSTGVKPGDMAGEAGQPAKSASQAGVEMGGSSSASSVAGAGGEAAKQAAETAAEAGKEAAETGAEVAESAAEGAAEGSVVPGVGTIVVAVVKVAWSLRKVIVRIIAVVLLFILIPICSLETLGEAMWTNAYDENGNEIEDASITSVYDDLEKVVQDVVDEAYENSLTKAKNITQKAKYSAYPEFNEIRDISGGPKLTTDICDVIATFTVMCKMQGKEPTAKYLKKCLEKNMDNFFPMETLDMLKFYYDTYSLASPQPYDEIIMCALKSDEYFASWSGFYPPNENQIGDNRTLGGTISYWRGPFQLTSGSSIYFYYAMTTDSLYKVTGKEIASNDGLPSINQYITLPNYIKQDVVVYYDGAAKEVKYGDLTNKDFYTPGWEEEIRTDGIDARKEKKHYFSEEGYDCVRVTVHPFNRDAMMECFVVDKFASYPLVSDIEVDSEGAYVADANGNAVRKTNYTSETYTCGMAITDYTEVLKEEIFGAKYGLAPADGIMKYEYKVQTLLGRAVSGVTVSMYTDSACQNLIATAISNSDGIATFTGFAKQVYYFKETAKPAGSLYVLNRRVTTLDNTDGHCMTWNFKVSSQGFICPLQINDETEKIAITSFFGYRESPTAGASTMHGGLDMCVHSDKGENLTYGRPVRAAADGKLIVSQEGSGYGYYIQIEHENGFTTLYGHNSQLCVNVGDTVKQGQIIAYAGGTPGTPGAGTSTGAHCHFEIRDPDGTKLNPLNYLPLKTN